MTTVERSPEAVNREFTQEFNNLVLRVLGEVPQRVFGWRTTMTRSASTFGHFKGWDIYARTKTPCLFGQLTKYHKQLVGRVETKCDWEWVANPGMSIFGIPIIPDSVMDEERIQRYRPSSVRLDDPAFLEPTQRFVEEYRSAFGKKLGITLNY